jgi:hypothetical protein
MIFSSVRHAFAKPAERSHAVKRWFPAVLAALFAFRLYFGLSSKFFFEDETQIFLLGLRYYATGEWPYFGPDVVWTRSEIPGALQGLLVGLPLRIAPIPEAPFVLLNLLSFAALAALAWYTCAHLPQAPRWLIWGWFMTVPWTLQFSTHVINPSYVLPAAILFFVGFFEVLPAFSLRRLAPAIGFAMMGAAVTWWSRRRDGPGRLARYAGAFAAGALLPVLALLPTLAQYGPNAGTGGVLRNLHPHWVNPWVAVTTLARFLSFASLEISRFITTDGAKRLEFFQRHLWLAPAAVALWAVGAVQPLWMLVDACRSSSRWPAALPRPQWIVLRRLAAGSVLLVYASYWWVIEPAQAHAFYVLAPIALVFAAFWWTFVDSPRARRVAAGILALNICFHAGLAWAQRDELSLYMNREPVAAAIRLKQPEMFAHRRDFAIGGGPIALADPSRPYDPRRDIEVVHAARRAGPRGSLHWSIVVRNRSTTVAYRDLLYITTYLDEQNGVVEERHERIKDIFQPGAMRAIELNDGFAGPPFASARLEVVAAEALVPVPR